MVGNSWHIISQAEGYDMPTIYLLAHYDNTQLLILYNQSRMKR